MLSDKCDIKFNLPFGYSKNQPMGDLLPSWANVDLSKITNDKNDKYLDPKMMELEGVVVDDSGSYNSRMATYCISGYSSVSLQS